MLQRIIDRTELPDLRATNTETGTALNIEEVMRRARQIHRQHGGIFGYDFDDWVLAWSTVTERNSGTFSAPPDEIEAALGIGDLAKATEPCVGCPA